MSSQNNIVMNIATMFEGLKGDSKQKLNNVAKLFAQTFDKFAQPFGINIDKKAIKTIEDLEKKFRELGITATQVGNQISLSMKTADGKFVSTSYQYEGGTAGKGSARLIQGATVQSASYLKPTEQLRRNYENVIKARKELDSLEQKGYSKTSDTWQKAEKSLEAYNTQLEETIESLKQRYNLTVNQDPITKEFIWGNGKGQLETLGRKYQHSMDYQASKKQDTANIEAQKQAVQQYVSALQAQYREEEKLVRLQQAKAPQAVIQAQQEVVNETRRQTQAVEQQAKSSEQYAKVADKVALADKKHKQTLAELTNTAQKSVSIFGKFKETLKQVISAGLSWKIFSAITQIAKQTIETVKELDKSLVNLQIATGSTRNQAEEMLKTYNQMAKELGTTTTKVADSANTWLRQGYSIEDTNLLIEQSTILAKVGMLEEAEAAKYLTSALKGYKQEAGDASRIIDMATKLDLQAAVDTGQLFEALSRTANLANEVGVEMNQVLAMISAGMEVTQQDAGSFGNALKTLFSRMSNVAAGKTIDDLGESLNDVEKSLNTNGIALRNSANEWRDYYEVLDEIYSKMQSGELEGVALSQVTTALGGTRQREAILTVLQNWDKVREYATSALDSVGTSVEKYNAYLQSIQAAQEKLKATFEDFSQTLVDSGIIKGFYDLGQGLLNFLTMIIKIKPLIPALLLLLEFKVLKYGIQNWSKLTKHLNLFKNSFPALKKAIEIFSHSMKAGNSVIQSFSYTLDQMKASAYGAQMSTAALSLAITAVTAAIVLGISAYQKHQQQIQEDIDQAKEHIETFKEEQKTLADLKQQYIDLSKSENYNDETRKSIQSIQEQINELVGGEAEALDLVNGKLDDQIKKLDEISVKNAQNNLKTLKGELDTIRKSAGKGMYSLWDYSGFTSKNPIKTTNLMSQLQNQGIDMTEAGLLMEVGIDNISIEQLEKAIKQFTLIRDKINSEEDNEYWNEVNNIVEELTTRLKDYNKALNDYTQTQAQVVVGQYLFNHNISNKEDLKAYIDTLKEGEYSEEALAAMTEVLITKFPQFAEELGLVSKKEDNVSEATNALSYDLKTLKDTYETLNSTIEEYNSNGSISYDTWKSLLEVEDQYLAALVDENGQIKSNNQALQDLIATKIEDETMTRIETYVNNLLTAAENGTLEQTLLLTEATNSNTEARMANVMAIIAGNEALSGQSSTILSVIEAMTNLSSSISIGTSSTEDSTKATDDWEAVLSYANNVLDEQIEKLEKQKETIEANIEEQIKAKEKEIELLEAEKEALEDKNDEKEKEIELAELQRNLQKAQQRTMRVYHEGKGWVYEQDPDAVAEAQQDLDEFYNEQAIEAIEDKIAALEDEVDALEKTTDEEEDSYDKRLKALDEQIAKAEAYKSKWNDVKSDYEAAQDAITAKALLGANAEKKILEGINGTGGRIGVFNTFKQGYTEALGEVASSTEGAASRVNTALGSFDFEKLNTLLAISRGEIPMGIEEVPMSISKQTAKFISSSETQSGEGYMYNPYTKRYYKNTDVSVDLETGQLTVAAGTEWYAKPYASGTKSAKSGLANVDENGNELIVPKQGRYRMMEYGDAVVPHNLSQKLFDVATNPLGFVANALRSVASPNLTSNYSTNSSNSAININTIELPSVTNGESFIKQLQLIAANR